MSNNKNKLWSLIEEKEILDNNQSSLEKSEKEKEYFNNMTFSILNWDEEKKYSKFAEIKSKKEFIEIYNSTEKWSLDFLRFIDICSENIQKIFNDNENEIFKYIDIFDWESVFKFLEWNGLDIKVSTKIKNKVFKNKLIDIEKFSIIFSIAPSLLLIFIDEILEEDILILEKNFPLLFEKNIDIYLKIYWIDKLNSLKEYNKEYLNIL